MKRQILLLLPFLLANSLWSQARLSVTFGSKYDAGTNTASTFTNEAGLGYDAATKGLMAIGYFPDGFDLESALQGQVFEPLLTAFNPLHFDDFSKVSASGYLSAARPVDEQPEGEGRKAYLLVLGGVTTWEERNAAVEMGLYSNKAMGAIPKGSSPTPTDYNTESILYDEIYLGDESRGEPLTGAFAGVIGNVYSTLSLVSFFAQNPPPVQTNAVLDAARTAASKAGATKEAVLTAARAAATKETNEYSIARDAAQAVAEHEFQTTGDATKAGQLAVETVRAAGVEEEDVEYAAVDAAAEAISGKALEQKRPAAEVSAKTYEAIVAAGHKDPEDAKVQTAHYVADKVTAKALQEGRTPGEAAAEAKAAAEATGLEPSHAADIAADIATEQATAKALEEGKSTAQAADDAKAAAAAAGLDTELAKDRAGDILARLISKKALDEGKTAAEVGAKALEATRAVGLDEEAARDIAGKMSAEAAGKKALDDGQTDEQARAAAKTAAEAAGIDADTSEEFATTSIDEVKKERQLQTGNRTPIVDKVQAHQIEGTKLLRITYDLRVADDFPCTITIRWSTDNGKTFPITAAAVTGKVGPGVLPGHGLEATWDMGLDWDDKFTDQGQVEVIANRIPEDDDDEQEPETP